MAASSPRITYTPRPDATPESGARTLAAVYRFILDRHAQKQAVDWGTQLQARKEAADERLTE